jgi:hypothetical protein
MDPLHTAWPYDSINRFHFHFAFSDGAVRDGWVLRCGPIKPVVIDHLMGTFPIFLVVRKAVTL